MYYIYFFKPLFFLERKNRSLEIALEESEKLLNETKSALQNISDRTKTEFDKKADVESLTVHYEEKLRFWG